MSDDATRAAGSGEPRRVCCPLGHAATAFSWLAAVASAGCATGPAFTTAEAPQAGHAVVYVYRTSALPGAGIKHDVFVDARPVGRLLNGSHLRIELPTTEQFVDLRARGCARLKQPLLLRPGDVAYVQLGLLHKTVELGGKYYFDYGCDLHRRGESDALPAITGLPAAD